MKRLQMNESANFRTRARIIQQLGYQLIKNESIALLELIKNSYDADASYCRISMKNVDNEKEGDIRITDDGEGMDRDILTNVWFELGTDYKDKLSENSETRRTPKYKRLRLGEKGIGRLGVHRLGRFIRIITKRNEREYVLTIDWDKIEKYKYLENLSFKIIDREPVLIKSDTGTIIIIKRLRVPWTRKMVRDCQRTITSLNSPFDAMDSFKATLSIDKKEWVSDLLNFEDIETYKLFSFSVKMKGNEITYFKYEFTPWKAMQKLKSRIITIEDDEVSKVKEMVYNENYQRYTIDLDKYNIGEVKLKGLIFDRDARTLDLGVQDRKGLKTYLDANGGIRVYRDNMRVFDYGEPGNDWLDLGGRRVNIPAKRISNNIIISAVYLNREKSTGLKEKANREGFIENDAYLMFIRSIIYSIEKIETFRKIDKDLLRKHYGPKRISEPVITSMFELKSVVDKNIKEESVRDKIYIYLDRIENEYEEITDSLIKSAGAGLNLVMVIHQMDKIIKDIISMLNRNAELKIILKRVKVLSSIVEGYSILVKKSNKQIRNLKGVIEQSIFNMNFRFEAHNIKIIPEFRSKKENTDGYCSEDHVLNALMNIFDNSIWWLGYSKIKNPEIFIDISGNLDGYVSILVADNGPGFTLPTEEIIKPFITNKSGGMGIGLHLTLQIMISLSGKLIFPVDSIFNFPEKYMKGAKIALAFKKEAKK